MLSTSRKREVDFEAASAVRRSSLRLWRVLWLALLVFCASSSPGNLPVHAQENAATSNETTEASAIPQAPVQVEGRVLFQIIGEDAADALRRADRVNRRLQQLIEREDEVPRFQPEDIEETSAGVAVLLGDEEVVTVTQADAQHYLKPAPELAQEWGTQLSRAVRRERIARSGTVNNILVLMMTSMFDLTRSVATWLPRMLGAVALAVVFWLLAWVVRWLTEKATLSRRLDPNVRQLSVAVAFYGVAGMGILAMLSALGIDSASIATTVGVSGFILGFAFKDVLAHFFAGLMLLVGRQFSIGGEIIVGQHEGTVERIDLRALHLRTFDNRLVTIPNGDVFNSAVIASTHKRYRRRDITVGIAYSDDARRAIEVAQDAVVGIEGVLSSPEPQVVAYGFGDSAVNLRVYFYTSTSHPNPLGIISECILRVKERFDAEGITIPFSTHTLDVRSAEGFEEVLKPVVRALHEPEASPNGHAERAQETRAPAR